MKRISYYKDTDYKDKKIALATKHGKERAVRCPIKAALGLDVVVPPDIDTDVFGTFTGEIERPGSPLKVLLYKARLGIKKTGLALGLANEGSFYPHPSMPFAAVDDELMVFVDEEKGLNVFEQIVTTDTNFAQTTVESFAQLASFLPRARFPEHALIVRPNDRLDAQTIYKGLHDPGELARAIEICRDASADGLARVETDMRAHHNPTRMRVIRRLAVKLARRLRSRCPLCEAPGFGLTGTEYDLPCGLCAAPTGLAGRHIFGCQNCSYEIRKKPDGAPDFADPAQCPACNP